MTDEIPNALTAEEWKPRLTYGDEESPQLSESPGELPNLWIKDGQIAVDSSALEYGPVLLSPFKVMALANAALPDGDPRKITREDVQMLESLVPVIANYDRHGDGNRVPHLTALAAKLAALLPP